MPDLPVMLKLEGRRCLIVGGGAVARRRAEAMLNVGAVVIVVAPRFDEGWATWCDQAGTPLQRIERPFEEADLEGVFMVVAATDDRTVNETVGTAARLRGVLVNRADDPDAGDVQIPAHRHDRGLTVAVHTAGASAGAAARIRDQMLGALDPAWPAVLEMAREYRPLLQAVLAGADVDRRDWLGQLTDSDALSRYKAEGEQGLREHCEAVLAKAGGSAIKR